MPTKNQTFRNGAVPNQGSIDQVNVSGFSELSYSTFDFSQIAPMKQITQIKLRSKKICQICSISAICEKYNSNLKTAPNLKYVAYK